MLNRMTDLRVPGGSRAVVGAVLVAGLAAALLFVATPVRAAGSPEPSGPVSLSVPLSGHAAAKVDPQIRMALALRERNQVSELKAMGRSVELRGESASALRFPALLRTTLSDADLASLGVIRRSRVGDIVTAEIAADAIDRVASHPGIESVEASRWLGPTLDASIEDIRADLVNMGAPTGYSGSGVLFGLLDDGIDITHNDFKGPDSKSRILYIWDQLSQVGPSPAGYNYGREYTKQQIDAGQASPFVNDGGHGSHVAGIAVGDGSGSPQGKYRGVAWEADIIAVRNGSTCDLFCYGGGDPFNGDATTAGSIDALVYMLDKADDLGVPLVVNQSQGVTMGPHDGTTLFEQAYENLVATRGLIIAIAAGNDQQRGWHGRKTVASGGEQTFTISKDNSQQADGWLSFECWTEVGRNCRWRLESPGGQQILIPAAYDPNDVGAQSIDDNDVVYYWSTTGSQHNGAGYLGVYVVDGAQAAVQGGDWTVTAISEGQGGVVDLFCERNQYTVEVTDGVSDEGIIGMPGTCSDAITVASYNTKIEWDARDGGHYVLQTEQLGEISNFSSHGPRRDGAQKPDIAAPGQMVASAFAAGSQAGDYIRTPNADGAYVLYQGTSMAAPHVAGTIALMLEKDPTLTPAEVKQILLDTARGDFDTGTVPNATWGYGKLDAAAAVEAVGGGAVQCATQDGDANEDSSVNILDVVSTVNHILELLPLDAGGQACANVNGDASINIQDVIAIVNIILDGVPAPAPQGLAGEAAPLAWGHEIAGDRVRFSVDGSRTAGLQMSYVLPLGWEAAGDPVLVGGASGAQVAHAVDGDGEGRYRLVAFNAARGALGSSTVTVEIPARRAFETGLDLSGFGISHLVVTDRSARLLTLAEVPTLGGGPAEAARVLSALHPAAPNPVYDVTQIRYELRSAGPVQLSVFDTSGRQVRSLWSGHQGAGGHTLPWDGRDDLGRKVPAGAYFVRLESADAQDTRKLLVVR